MDCICTTKRCFYFRIQVKSCPEVASGRGKLISFLPHTFRASVFFAAVTFTVVGGCSFRAVSVRQTGVPPKAGITAKKSESRSSGADIGFASRSKLAEHYKRHGREFGFITIEEYLQQAQSLRDRPVGGNVLETVRADGVVTRFDRGSGAFIAFEADGTIRTYFRPNAGESYFLRQTQRG